MATNWIKQYTRDRYKEFDKAESVKLEYLSNDIKLAVFLRYALNTAYIIRYSKDEIIEIQNQAIDYFYTKQGIE